MRTVMTLLEGTEKRGAAQSFPTAVALSREIIMYIILVYWLCIDRVLLFILFLEQVDYKFMVHHYAGEIVYATEGFLEKNRDMLHQEGIDLLRSSSSEFIRSLVDRYAVSGYLRGK